MANRYTSPQPLKLDPTLKGSKFNRADLRLHNVDHSGASYEGRVFLNNSQADENTLQTSDTGYAGSFFVFGHGGCYGNIGHCDVPRTRRAYDLRPPHPLTPTNVTTTITDALKRALLDRDTLTVTIVPIVKGKSDKFDVDDVIKFDNLEIVTYAE